MEDLGRVLIWFSCGAASAVAAYLGVQKYPEAQLIYCDTMVNEHPDNERFLQDVERWTEKSVTRIRSSKYESVDEVIQITKYISGPKGAPCTRELKKIPRFNFQQPGDLHIFGMTADEWERILKFRKSNPELDFDWILWKKGITHEDCLDMLKDARIDLPTMYKLGFKNNNCIGCVKAGGVHYWAKIRKFFPEVFEKRCVQSRAIRARLLMFEGTRIYLDQLPANVDVEGNDEEQIECGVFCVSERAK